MISANHGKHLIANTSSISYNHDEHPGIRGFTMMSFRGCKWKTSMELWHLQNMFLLGTRTSHFLAICTISHSLKSTMYS